jgi:uncharacterized membrane protein
MAVAALITWLITAVGGFVMLGLWVSGGGHRGGSGTRLVPGLVFTHFALAAIGLVVWIVFVVVDRTAVAWVGFVLLLPVALLGFTMLARWLGSRSTGAAESRFPVPVVIGHGLFAATTLVLTLLTALGVGAS